MQNSVPHRETRSYSGSIARVKSKKTARPQRGKGAGDRHFVTALARGLAVLSCFRATDNMLSNGEIAARCKLPKSTVSRLTYTLTETAYLEYVADRTMYRLGTAALAIGTAMLSSRIGVRLLARPLMQELAEYSRSVVALGVRVGVGIIYVETCRTKSTLTLTLDVGSRVPLASTAIGRAYYAAASEAERKLIVRELRETEGSRWPRIRADLEAALAEAERVGCCSSFGHWQPDVNGIAVGVRPTGGGPAMALNVGGPSFKLPSEFLLEKVRPRLIEVAQTIETSLRKD